MHYGAAPGKHPQKPALRFLSRIPREKTRIPIIAVQRAAQRSTHAEVVRSSRRGRSTELTPRSFDRAHAEVHKPKVRRARARTSGDIAKYSAPGWSRTWGCGRK